MRRFLITFVVCGFLLIACVEHAQAYIGPGAGFAFLSSFLFLFIAFTLAIFYLLSWPFRLAIRGLLRRGSSRRRKPLVKRAIVLGLDGLDPNLAVKFMDEGKLPNFRKLKEQGSFKPLSTTWPSMSPVAWSTFATGVDPSFHNIFDFLTRNPSTYLPMLSSAEIGKSSRVLSFGKYRIHLGKPILRLFRKSKTFWKILGENGVFSSIIRVPITFPPEKFNGVLLSAMCTPDLKGSQGTFSFYTTNGSDGRAKTGGLGYHVTREDNVIRTFVYGPENALLKDSGEMKVPLTIILNQEGNGAEIRVCGQRLRLEAGTYSPWTKVVFRPGLNIKVHGVCRFYLNRINPDFELYVSPINIDPERPALPISHPFVYSVYLSKLIGTYGTLGLAEDTWALNEEVIDEDAFLQQARLLFNERERMFFNALEKTSRGLCVCVFDTTDRVQHMFFRTLDGRHPANRGREIEKHKNVIEDLYVQMDQLVGQVLEKVDAQTPLFIMSDHGFTSFRRGMNLNTWLFRNGYLALRNGRKTGGDWFENVDWERTRAYSMGLAGIFVNRKGREAQGIVPDGKELRELRAELIEKLTGIVDEETGETAIQRVMDTESTFSGPYRFDAPDLLIGYNKGYRSSWACATGGVTESVFEDNMKHWSGDHCVDPLAVPGVLFSNLKILREDPDIKDIAPTLLKLFGVDIPTHMQGEPLV